MAGGTSRLESTAKPHGIKAAHRRRRKCSTGHSLYANDNPARYTDPTGRCVDGLTCAAMGQSFAAHPEAAAPFVVPAAVAAGVMAIAPVAVIAGEAAITNPVAAVHTVNAVAEALAGDAVGGASLTVGAVSAGKAVKSAVDIGEHAGESIAARSAARNFTTAERTEVNRIGSETGCHSCGTKSPGTKSGNFVPDHQPPNALNPSGAPQRLYPQCIKCSREQGLELARRLRADGK